MLNAAFATADGKPPVGEEPSPAWVLGHDFLAADVDLDHDTLVPLEAEHAAQIATDLATSPFSAEAAYELRARRREHDLTADLVENYARLVREEAAVLRARRENAVREETAALRARLNEVKASVRAHQRDATVPMDVATTMLATIDAIRPHQRYDFSRAHARLDDVEAGLGRHHARPGRRSKRRDRRRRRDQHRGRRAPRPALLDGRRGSGRRRTGVPRAAAHHGRSCPSRGAKASTSTGSSPASSTTPPPTPTCSSETAEALHGNKASAAVRDLERLAEVELSSQQEGSRRVAAPALGAWQTMATKKNVDVDTVLKARAAAARLRVQVAAASSTKPQPGPPVDPAQPGHRHRAGPRPRPRLADEPRRHVSLRVLHRAASHRPRHPDRVAARGTAPRTPSWSCTSSGSYTPRSGARSPTPPAAARARSPSSSTRPSWPTWPCSRRPNRATLAALTLPFTADEPVPRPRRTHRAGDVLRPRPRNAAR